MPLKMRGNARLCARRGRLSETRRGNQRDTRRCCVKRLPFDAAMETPLPRPLSARTLEFSVKPGARWHVDSVAVTGLTALPEKTAQEFFRTESMLFDLAKNKCLFAGARRKRRRRTAGRVAAARIRRRVVHADIAKANEANGP